MSTSWIDSPGKVTLVVALVGLVGGFFIVLGQLAATTIPIWLGPDLSDFNIICDPAYHEIDLNTPPNIPPFVDKDDYNLKLGGIPIGSKKFIVPRPIKNEDLLVTLGTVTQNSSYILEYGVFSSEISIASLHPLQKYKRDVNLIVACPVGFSASLSNSTLSLGRPVKLKVVANITYFKKTIFGTLGLFSHSTNELIFSIKNEKTVIPITIEGIGADGKRRNSTMLIAMKSQTGSDLWAYITKPNETETFMGSSI
jgi:hypothetical protein